MLPYLLFLYLLLEGTKANEIQSTVNEFFNVGTSSEMEEGPTHMFSGVEDFSLRNIDHFGRSLASNEHAPFGSQLKLSFSVTGRVGRSYHAITLDLHRDLFGDAAVYRSTDSVGTTKHRLPNQAYRASLRDKHGAGPELGWVRATIVNENEAHIYILDYLRGDLLVVEPTESALGHSPDHPDVRRLANAGHKMVAYMHEADAHDRHQKSGPFRRMRRLVQEHAKRHAHELMRSQDKNQRRRHLALMPSWLRNSIGVYKGAYGRMSGTDGINTVTCPAIQQVMKMGIACDAGFYQAVTGATTSNTANDRKVVVLITNIMNVANVLYTDQINVFVQLAEVVLYASPDTGLSWDSAGDSSTDWNQKPTQVNFGGNDRGSLGCDSSRLAGTNGDYSTFLNKFRAWRNNNMVSMQTTRFSVEKF